jgi:hypothetical protein
LDPSTLVPLPILEEGEENNVSVQTTTTTDPLGIAIQATMRAIDMGDDY